MKIHIHAHSWLVLQAESISEGVQLGVLQEQLKASDRNISVIGGDVLEIMLSESDTIINRRIEEIKKAKITPKKR